MARILITGGAGFIGSHTAQSLVEAGHQVCVLDSLDAQVHGDAGQWPGYLNPQVRTVRGDVRDPAAVAKAIEGAEIVFHFAALTGVGQSMYEMQRYVDTNVRGTAVLLDALAARQRRGGGAVGLRRLVLASSRAVYGEGTFACSHCGEVYPGVRARQALEAGDFAVHCPRCHREVTPVPTREDRPCTPISIYGSTKLHQEDYCRQAAQAHGLPVTCLRYFNVYGSRQALSNPYTGVVSVFYGRLRAQEPVSLYEHGLPLRDFVHVKDVVQANLLAMEADVAPGTCINIGSGQDHRIRELAEILRDLAGSPSVLLDTGKFRAGDVWACGADLTRARKLLGYEPRVSLREGLGEVLDWADRQQLVDRSAQAEAELLDHGLLGQAAAGVHHG